MLASSQQYRKKPIVIEAVPWDPDAPGDTYPEWFWDTFGIHPDCVEAGTGRLVIRTLEGTMHAEVGDMVIRGVQGEVYPCQPDIFALTYEPVDKPPTVNLLEAGARLVSHWETHGFHGVPLDCEVQYPDVEDWVGFDERPFADFADHCRDYCLLSVRPDFCVRDPGNDYVDVLVDTEGFYRDLFAEIKRTVGDDVRLVLNRHADELELQRERT